MTPVIGLAGGIGSGKSTVASAFAELGCLVLDSDAEAKQALQRPEVRDQLVGWWGPGVLDESGAIDRRRVAQIVFADADERRRLEGLIHPLVKKSRREAIGLARGKPGVVIDAPLLFEAGLEGECDEVVFVEASRARRLERVLRTRGWDEEEFERREAAQMPLEEKRRRCGFVIVNEDDGPRVEEARAVLEAIRKGSAGGSGA
ncbi:MAG: dephospho-CoA kinase [Phycisphaerales bacterium]|nr:MAG: dephospho-CoA kinase [Phycisphaerales bacterium]